jgi:hypothetical protein
MKKLFILLFFFSFSGLYAQSISYTSEEEHAQKWLVATTNFTGLPVNSLFPENEFATLEGESIRIPAAGKKLYVLHFWFVGCGAFQEEEDYLRRLQDELKNNTDIAFISFCASPEEEITEYFQSNDPLGYQLVSMGNKENTKELFKVAATTTHMLVDAEGRIIENFTAPIDFDEMYAHYKNKIMENLQK